MTSLITIQSSFENVIDDCRQGIVDEEDIWINRRPLDCPNESSTEYFTVNITKGNLDHYSKDQVTITPLTSNQYEVRIGDDKYVLECGSRVMPVSENINSIALATNAGEPSAAVVAKDFEVDYCNIKEKRIANKLHFSKEDVNDILMVYLFPSNTVIITVNLNYSCNIYPFPLEPTKREQSETGSPSDTESENVSPKPVRTFVGHKKTITSLQLIGNKGRNFLTSSKDGKVNLWDCGSGQLLKSFYRINGIDDPVNDIVMGSIDALNSTSTKPSDLEFETTGKCFYAGYDSGIIQQFDIVNHNQTKLRFESGHTVVKLVNIEDKYIISGHEKGLLTVWSLQTNTKVVQVELNREYPLSLIEYIELKDNMLQLIVYNGPETLVRVWIDLDLGSLSKLHYLVGLPEVFQITGIAKKDRELYVVGDGIFYSYRV